MERRLVSVGSSWSDLRAVVLTHTHGDHVDQAKPLSAGSRSVGFHSTANEGHLRGLRRLEQMPRLEESGLLRTYDERPFLTPDGVRVEPIELSHDGGPTFGFRVEGRGEAAGHARSRSATWPTRASGRPQWRMPLGDVDLLGVEFNHDVELQPPIGQVAPSDRTESRQPGPSLESRRTGAAAGRGGSGTRSSPGNHEAPGPAPPERAVQSARPRPQGAARSAIRGSGRRVAIHVRRSRASPHRISSSPREVPGARKAPARASGMLF